MNAWKLFNFYGWITAICSAVYKKTMTQNYTGYKSSMYTVQCVSLGNKKIKNVKKISGNMSISVFLIREYFLKNLIRGSLILNYGPDS
jgi:hypothetical protein